ncbi:MAG: transposase [Candidatus Methylomirabilales bacterium]
MSGSEHILALAANAFVGGDFLEDLGALREDVAIKKVIGREEIPDPTTAGDFCRRFKLGQIAQIEKAFTEIRQNVYTRRPEVRTWTVHVDAKVHEVYGKQKQGAARAYNGVYSLHPMYAFVQETDELAYVRLRSGNTHPGIRRFLSSVTSSVRSLLRSRKSTCRAIRPFTTKRWWRSARGWGGGSPSPQIKPPR